MARRPAIPPRKAFFLGAEGPSERGFIRFLQLCCDHAGLHVHLKVVEGSGGDSSVVVEEAGRALVRSSSRRQFVDKLVLLDADRAARNPKERHEASNAARRYGLRLVYLRPNMEGLLVRLHPGRETSTVPARDALRQLRRLWPEYRKPPTADQLAQRFTLDDLKRAARHDDQLGRLLRIVGVIS